jgi:hypothetical protein
MASEIGSLLDLGEDGAAIQEFFRQQETRGRRLTLEDTADGIVFETRRSEEPAILRRKRESVEQNPSFAVPLERVAITDLFEGIFTRAELK